MKSNRKFEYQVYKVIILKCQFHNVSVCLIMKLVYFLFIHGVFYWRIMIATTRSDELRHSPAARDRKLSSRVIAIIIRSLNKLLRTE
jgi:hypothetical protein